jgi:AraC-like DNA-binding protein
VDKAYAMERGNTILTYLLECISQGKCAEIKGIFSGSEYPVLARLTIGNDVSMAQTVLVFILPQVMRASITGGISWRYCNEIYFKYIERVKQATSVFQLTELYKEMILEFAENVARIQEHRSFSPVVRKCCSYIDEHICEPLYVAQIADALHVSSSYLSRIYKKEVGISISDYIRQRKIREAKWLLEHTSLSVSSVFGKLSFCSQSYFTVIFRRETGMTPCVFRNSVNLRYSESCV